MVNMKGKGKALISKSKPKKNDPANNAEVETTESEPMKINVEEPMIVLGGDEKEGNTKEEVKNEEKVEENSKEKVNKSRKRSRKKKMALRITDALATKDSDKPESSEKKASKKVESMGMIFMCSSKTKKDCYRYKVLGLPASKRDLVSKVYKGMRLFLFDFDLRLLYGIYKAAGPGGYNIEPKAFKSSFPAQVRFTVLEDCLPLAEEKFKKVIKDNYYAKNKFNCQLTSDQVKNLCKLFRVADKGPKSKRSDRSLRAEAHRTFVDRDIIRRRGLVEERPPALRGDRLYHEDPVVYEREAFVSPVAPPPLRQPLPPPAPRLPPPSYAYERPLGLLDVYRQDPLLEHHDRRFLDLELRYRDEIERRDPYTIYREPPLYRDPLRSAGVPPEYYPPAGPPPEYHAPAGPLTDYPPRPLYRY